MDQSTSTIPEAASPQPHTKHTNQKSAPNGSAGVNNV